VAADGINRLNSEIGRFLQLPDMKDLLREADHGKGSVAEGAK